MPRRPRLFVPGAIYRVYSRAARGEFVFDEHDASIEFIDTFKWGRELAGGGPLTRVCIGINLKVIHPEAANWRL